MEELSVMVEKRAIRFVGGGPDNGVDSRYLGELDRIAFAIFDGNDALESWWAEAPVDALELWYWMDKEEVVYRTRRSANRMTAQIERSAQSTREAADPAALARGDVIRLLERVADKMGLGPVPAL
jgi:hypothetical protein